jgi:Ca2+-binding EF-hand superfamily protein
MKNTNILLGMATVLAVASIATATLSFANEPYFPRNERGFARVDVNKDGKIALAEFSPIAEKRLSRLDTNGDKAVTAAEIDGRFRELIERRRARIMALMDVDGNGTITTAELDKVTEAMFNGADTDKDGGLTMTELQSFKRAAWRRSFVESLKPQPSSAN